MVAVAQDEVLATRVRLVNDLLIELQRRAKDAGDAREVRLVETQLSWVLIGPEVYKVKKPVSYPFVDFLSFEARERACRNEVRINRRLAPRTYLGVVPVRRRSDGRFTLDAGGGAIIEWAVRMKRLEESRQADLRLAAGTLEGATIDALARAIAAFHADSPTGPRIVRCGAPELIEAHMQENFTALREGTEFDGLDEIERWQTAFVRERRTLFEGRMASGAIRDGHGDLRLEHVFVRDDDDFEIIDGLEFDDRYRWGDVAADVAFLAMDLARLGRVDLAERFVAAYARATDDFDLYGVLDFYESYRACVRAKVRAISSNDEARRCLLLAQSARKRSVLDPILVCVGGGIACGKSTLADRLGERLGAPVIDADRTRKHLLGLAASEHAPSGGAWQGAYDPEFSVKVYDEVLRRAGVVLASGRPVILDASFRTVRGRAAAQELAKKHGVPFRFVDCQVPAEIARARLAARDPKSTVSDATPEIFDAFMKGYEPVTEITGKELVRVDTSGEVDVSLAAILKEITGWPTGLVT